MRATTTVIVGDEWTGMFESVLNGWGRWVAPSVKHPTSAQVMISRSMSSSPASGSALTSWSLDPASGSVSPSLSVPPLLMLCLSLSLSKINKNMKKNFFKSVKGQLLLASDAGVLFVVVIRSFHLMFSSG